MSALELLQSALAAALRALDDVRRQEANLLVRCDASVAASASLLPGVAIEGDHSVAESRAAVAARAKALHSLAEEQTATGEQLLAYACMLEEDLDAGATVLTNPASDSVAVVLCAALLPPPPFTYVALPAPCDDDDVICDCVSLRDGARLVAIADGYGLVGYCTLPVQKPRWQASDANLQNPIRVRLLCEDGRPWGDVDGANVTVVVDGGTVSGPTQYPGAHGVLKYTYAVTEGWQGPITVHISAYDAPLPGSPWTLQRDMRGEDLRYIPCDRATRRLLFALLRQLLPGKRFDPLFVQSVHAGDKWTRRDSLARRAHAFHASCDGCGPTLTLVHTSSCGFIGGYTSSSWESPPEPRHVACADAFLVSVRGPFGHPVSYPIRAGQAAFAMWCDRACGPSFGNSAVLLSGLGEVGRGSVVGEEEAYALPVMRLYGKERMSMAVDWIAVYAVR